MDDEELTVEQRMSLALSEEKGIKHQKMSPGFEESDITRKPKKKVLLKSCKKTS